MLRTPSLSECSFPAPPTTQGCVWINTATPGGEGMQELRSIRMPSEKPRPLSVRFPILAQVKDHCAQTLTPPPLNPREPFGPPQHGAVGFSTDHGIPLAQKCSQSLTVLAVTRLANAQTARCFASRCGKPSGCAFDLGAAVNVIISEPGPAGESVGRWRMGGLVSRLWTIPSPVT